MSDDNLEIEYDDQGNEFVRIPVDQARNQRELARRATAGEQATAELAQAQRELAFLRAGIKSDTSIGQLFVKGYEGELTTEAIKAAAAEIPGLLEAPAQLPAEGEQQPQGEQQPSDEELAEQRTRQQLAQGTGPNQIPQEKPGVEAASELVTQFRQEGRRQEVAQGLGVAALATAAAKGDKSVLVQQAPPA